MRKTQVEETLELVGINPRDENGEIRSADDLAEEVMDLLERCDGVSKMFILTMIQLSKKIDDDMYFLYPDRFKEN